MCAVLAWATLGAAQEEVPIPEPNITYLGEVPAGSQVSIEHLAGSLGSTLAGGGSYIIPVHLVQPVTDPAPVLPAAGTAYVGDTATLLIDGIAQGQVVLEERGAVYRLDVPSPVLVPAPDEVLNPTRVVPSIPDASPTPTRTMVTPTVTPTPGGPGCVGDCSNDRRVAIHELVRGVRIAFVLASIDQCPSLDRNRDGRVAVDELIAAVNNALEGCSEAR